MTTRALYVPGRDPLPDGNALPIGGSPAARREREELRQAVVAETPRPLWSTTPEYDALIAERMRAMTMNERIAIEIDLLERNKSRVEVEYDPLRY